MTTAVQNILDQIRRLDPAEREALDDALRLEEYRNFQRLAEAERAKFAAQGLTEEDIDRAVAEVRYGKKTP